MLELVGAALLLLLLPVFLVTALLLPLALWSEALSERRRLCPHCGLRGTLRDVTPPCPHPPGGERWSLDRRRTVLNRRWRCKVCEAEFGEREGQRPHPVPDTSAGTR